MDAEQIWGQPKDVYLGGSLCFILVVVTVTQFSLRNVHGRGELGR